MCSTIRPYNPYLLCDFLDEVYLRGSKEVSNELISL